MEKYILEFVSGEIRVYTNPNAVIRKNSIIIGDYIIDQFELLDIKAMYVVKLTPSTNYHGEFERSKTKINFEQLKKTLQGEDIYDEE